MSSQTLRLLPLTFEHVQPVQNDLRQAERALGAKNSIYEIASSVRLKRFMREGLNERLFLLSINIVTLETVKR